MSESNTENTIEIDFAKPVENSKHTQLNNSVIYIEYHYEKLLYPYGVLEKWKRELEIIRSKKDINTNRSSVTTPVNNEPKHDIFKNIKTEDSFSVLPYEKDVAG